MITLLITALYLHFSFVLFLLLLLLLFIKVSGLFLLFKKAGIEGWKSIIPFYNTYLFFAEICKTHWAIPALYILIQVGALSSTGTLLSIIQILIYALGYYNLAKKMHLNEPPVFIFGSLFPEITNFVLGASKDYHYDSSVSTNEWSFFSKIK